MNEIFTLWRNRNVRGISLSSSPPQWSPTPPAAHCTPEPASGSLPLLFDQVLPDNRDINTDFNLFYLHHWWDKHPKIHSCCFVSNIYVSRMTRNPWGAALVSTKGSIKNWTSCNIFCYNYENKPNYCLKNSAEKGLPCGINTSHETEILLHFKSSCFLQIHNIQQVHVWGHIVFICIIIYKRVRVRSRCILK